MANLKAVDALTTSDDTFIKKLDKTFDVYCKGNIGFTSAIREGIDPANDKVSDLCNWFHTKQSSMDDAELRKGFGDTIRTILKRESKELDYNLTIKKVKQDDINNDVLGYYSIDERYAMALVSKAKPQATEGGEGEEEEGTPSSLSDLEKAVQVAYNAWLQNKCAVTVNALVKAVNAATDAEQIKAA